MEDLHQEGQAKDSGHTTDDCSKCANRGQVDCLSCIKKQLDTGVAEAPTSKE